MAGWVALVVIFAMAGLGAWLANSRGRSAAGWFFVVLLTHLIGLAILMVLPRVRLTCPQCTHPYTRGAAACDACGATLPAADLVDRLRPGERYEGRCPNCETPYREDDYQLDAEHIYCSACRQELPRNHSAVTRTREHAT